LIRGHKVILDRELARLYGVSTRTLNQAVKRNRNRFPDDFMFQLTPEEAAAWHETTLTRSMPQNVTLNRPFLRSQSVILKNQAGKHIKYRPYAFTEHGS
jgi:hypothetical protein